MCMVGKAGRGLAMPTEAEKVLKLANKVVEHAQVVWARPDQSKEAA